jgi:ComF family protein
MENLLCRMCRMSPPPFRQVVTYGAYEKEFRRLVHLFKYNGLTGLDRPLGRLLAQALASIAPELPEQMLVVPVPLAKEKQKERGYNQAELLARSAVKALATLRPQWRLRMAASMLQRSRATESQARLTPHQRRRNLRGAFFVPNPEQLHGQPVLLIDDVYTTGATARECTRTLLAAGAASVWIGTLTRDQKEGIAFWQKKQEGVP